MSNEKFKRLGPLGVILLVAVIGVVFLRDHLTYQALSENRDALLAYRDAHFALSVVIFVLGYIAIVAFSLPGATIATLTGGFLFGLFPGVIFNLLGATTGATLIFLAARFGLGERLAARMEAGAGRIARLKRGIDENQWSVLFLMRLVPAVPFFVANVVPALLNVPAYRFIVTTALGIIPGTAIYTSVGAGLGEVFAAGTAPDLGVIFEPFVLGPILGLCALAALPIILRMFRKDPVA